MLCQKILPAGLIGLVLAGMISATSSKANTTINLAATVFSTDLYKNLIRPAAGDKELILVARIFTVLFGVGTVVIAILIPRIGGIVDFVLSIASIAGGALFAPIIWSLFSKRQTAASVVTVTILTLSINLFLKMGAPALLNLKLNRTWETVIGQAIPLVSLFLYEWYYKLKGFVAPIDQTILNQPVVDLEAIDASEDAEAQNTFGIRVIAGAMAVVGIGISILGLISDTMSTVVTSVGIIIIAFAILIGVLTFRKKPLVSRSISSLL
jgi:hypothetical protein